jgi:hypothetical protein
MNRPFDFLSVCYRLAVATIISTAAAIGRSTVVIIPMAASSTDIGEVKERAGLDIDRSIIDDRSGGIDDRGIIDDRLGGIDDRGIIDDGGRIDSLPNDDRGIITDPH